MASTLQLLDADDATILFDLNDPTGANNPRSVRTYYGLGGSFQASSPSLEVVHFAPRTAPGGEVLWSRDGLKTASWRTRIKAASYDDLAAAVGRLGELLRDGGRPLKWVADGSAETRFLDLEPSPAPALFRGELRELNAVIRQFDTPKGVEIVVTRQPHARSASLDSASNLVKNPFLIWDTQAPTGTPDDWAWDNTGGITNQAIDATRNGHTFDIATTANRNLQQTTTAASFAAGDIAPVSFHATRLAGSSARARAVVEYLNAAGTPLATHTGSLVTLSATEQRVSVVPAAAPANTDKVRASLQMANSDANSNTVLVAKVQIEKGSAVSAFRCSSQTVHNDPAGATGRAFLVWTDGDMPCPGILTFKSPDASPKIVQILGAMLADGAVRGTRRLAEFINTRKFFQAESGTLTNDTSSVADAGASGGNVARTTYATNPTVMAKRDRINLTTLLETLRGYWDVYVRVKATAAAKHILQLRSGSSAADPAPYSSGEVAHDASNASSFGAVMKRLGAIYVPLDPEVSLAALAYELWSRRESGTGSLDWDYVTFVPTDPEFMATLVLVPAADAEERWLGKDLVTPYTNPGGATAGSVSGNDMNLNAATEGAGTPPNAGLVWGVGRHKVTFSINGVINPATQTRAFTLRVRNITDSTDAVTRNYSGSQPDELEVEFDGVAGKAYQAQAVVTSISAATLLIHEVRHNFVAALGQNEQVRLDPGRRPPAVEKLDAGGKLLSFLDVQGGVLGWFPPGLSVVYVAVQDTASMGYTEPSDVLARTLVASYAHAPRWSQP